MILLAVLFVIFFSFFFFRFGHPFANVGLKCVYSVWQEIRKVIGIWNLEFRIWDNLGKNQRTNWSMCCNYFSITFLMSVVSIGRLIMYIFFISNGVVYLSTVLQILYRFFAHNLYLLIQLCLAKYEYRMRLVGKVLVQQNIINGFSRMFNSR